MNNTQKLLFTMLVIVVVAGLLITLQRYHGLQATALFYIGLPAILSFVLIMTDKGRTPMTSTMKGITLALLLSAPLLQEGFLCILFAAPIFYAVGAIVAWIYVRMQNRDKHKLHSFAPLLLLAVVSLEGTHETLTFPRDNHVVVEKVVALNVQQVNERLAQPIQYGNSAPLFLKIFPFPQVVLHEGTKVGDRQVLHFDYYKHFVTNVSRGDITFEIVSRGEGHIASRVLKDASYLHTYMQWQTSTVRWQALDEQHTRIEWEVSYQRKLDPAWYFGPLESWVTRMAAMTLLESAVADRAE